MIFIDQRDGYFVLIKARGGSILLEGLRKTKKHACQGSQLVGREISNINWIARVFWWRGGQTIVNRAKFWGGGVWE